MASPYLDFDRASWAALRAATPLTLSEVDLAELRGLNERISLEEVETIYLPLSRLLNLHVSATQTLHKATDTFLGSLPAPTPYVIGVAGSVAVLMALVIAAKKTATSEKTAATTSGMVVPSAAVVDSMMLPVSLKM